MWGFTIGFKLQPAKHIKKNVDWSLKPWLWQVDGLKIDEMMVGSRVEPRVPTLALWCHQTWAGTAPMWISHLRLLNGRILFTDYSNIIFVIYIYIFIYDVPEFYAILFHYIHLYSILSPCWLVKSHYTTMKSLLSDACRVLCLWVFLWLCTRGHWPHSVTVATCLKTCRKIPWTELTS
jgi:hypothetical protein